MAGGSHNRSKLGGVVGAVLGVLFGAAFVVGGLWARSITQPLDDGVVVMGEVVDIDVRTDSDGDTTYAPVVDYVDPATGIVHRLTGSVSSSSRPPLGSSQEVSLRPGEPESARVVGPAWFPWIFIAVGGAIVCAVLAGVVATLRGSMTVDRRISESIAGRTLGPGNGNHEWTMIDDPAQPVAAGYHPDPDDPYRLRYWDGQRWTDDHAPKIVD